MTSSVLDAKEAYSRGNTELVDIELTEGFVVTGIKSERQESMRKLHRVHAQ